MKRKKKLAWLDVALFPGIVVLGTLLYKYAVAMSANRFHRVGRQNKIRVDSQGDGHFGSSRSNHVHQGLDLVITPGEAVLSPISGQVVKYSNPYANDPSYTGLWIQNDSYLVKMWYLTPIVKPGQEVRAGRKIGTAQKISAKYGGNMIDHIHLEVWVDNQPVDPAPFFGLG